MPNLPQPSIRADSSISLGRLRMNCTRRNTKKASVAKSLGRIKGRNVSIQPKERKMMYRGMVVTCPGSIMVRIIRANQKFRPLKRSRAKA